MSWRINSSALKATAAVVISCKVSLVSTWRWSWLMWTIPLRAWISHWCRGRWRCRRRWGRWWGASLWSSSESRKQDLRLGVLISSTLLTLLCIFIITTTTPYQHFSGHYTLLVNQHRLKVYERCKDVLVADSLKSRSELLLLEKPQDCQLVTSISLS